MPDSDEYQNKTFCRVRFEEGIRAYKRGKYSLVKPFNQEPYNQKDEQELF